MQAVKRCDSFCSSIFLCGRKVGNFGMNHIKRQCLSRQHLIIAGPCAFKMLLRRPIWNSIWRHRVAPISHIYETVDLRSTDCCLVLVYLDVNCISSSPGHTGHLSPILITPKDTKILFLGHYVANSWVGKSFSHLPLPANSPSPHTHNAPVTISGVIRT